MKKQKRLPKDLTIEVGQEQVKKTFFKSKKKVKVKKIRTPFRVAMINFFVRFMNDMLRIKWVKKALLGKRFLIVLIFIFVFGLMFGLVDTFLNYVLHLAHIF